MSFIKKQMVQGDKVIDYTNDLEDRVDTFSQEVDTFSQDTDSKLMQLLTWMGLVKDYVVEIGGNANGSYEKWNSGKMTLTKRESVNIPVNVSELSGFRTNSPIQVDYGQTFVGTPIIKSITVDELCWASLDTHSPTYVRFFGLTFRSTRVITKISVDVEGKWK